MDEEEVLPDVPKVLNFLRKNKVPMGLGSASKNARPILKKVGLIPYFNTIVDGTQVTKAKPDPEVFMIAAKDMNLPPENCIVFEDAIAGIQAANAAGMVSVGIGDQNTLSEARYVFRDFTEIDLDFIKELAEL